MHVNRPKGPPAAATSEPEAGSGDSGCRGFHESVTNCHRSIMQRFQPNKVQHMQCGSDGDNRARL